MMVVLGLADGRSRGGRAYAPKLTSGWRTSTPRQVVIAGAPDALEIAAGIARSLGAKRVLPIPVGGAFHTPYMTPARERLRKAINSTTFRDPDPVVV